MDLAQHSRRARLGAPAQEAKSGEIEIMANGDVVKLA